MVSCVLCVLESVMRRVVCRVYKSQLCGELCAVCTRVSYVVSCVMCVLESVMW